MRKLVDGKCVVQIKLLVERGERWEGEGEYSVQVFIFPLFGVFIHTDSALRLCQEHSRSLIIIDS